MDVDDNFSCLDGSPLSAFLPRYTLPFVSTVTEIREAIQKLPPKEAWKLAQELHERLDGLWDEEFEQDVKAGRLDGVIARARAEHAAGKTRSMDEIVGDQ